MVSQETQQKGYLLGLVLNGMNKTLEITLQGIILHWQGNGQDNVTVLFISNPQSYSRKYHEERFCSLNLALFYDQNFFYPTKSHLWCGVKLSPAHQEVKRTVYEIFWEEQVFTVLRVSGRSSSSAGITVLARVTVLAEWLYFPSLTFNTLRGYRRGLQKPLLLWGSCSDFSPIRS